MSDIVWGQQHSVTTDVGTFDVRVDGPGDGDPVVLLHGFPETSLSWAAVVPALVDAGLRVVAPDQRGYSPGARPDGVEHYATATLAQDVVDLADALGLDTFHLVGHDWGAIVAWLVAAHHPARVRTLTAVSVPHPAAFGLAVATDPDQQQRSSYFGLFRQPSKAEEVLLSDGAQRLRDMYGGHVPPEAVDAYVAQLSEPGALTAALSWYRAMRRDLDQTPAVTVPTTYVWSTGDLALGRFGAERCGDHVEADYAFVELADVSHWVPEQAPNDLATAVLRRVAG